ncbi:MAG TPA: outer membrane protein [Mesorhizobium sp.]
MKANLKHVRPLAAALGLLAFAGVPAFAADVVSEEPPAPAPVAELPLASWAGPYAGINLGYGFSGRTDDGGNRFKTDGFIGSGFVGYNWQMDNFVLGAEGELGYNGVKGGNDLSESKSGFEGSLRARLGYAVTPEILLYGTAGGAGQSLKVSDATGSDKNSMFGWTAGVGTDIKLTDNIFGRVEYRYTDYGSKDFTTPLGTRDVDSHDNRVTFGVGMKF